MHTACQLVCIVNRQLSEVFDARIGVHIKAVRKALKLTGKELGDALGITRVYLSAIENGKKFPGPKVLDALHRVYRVSPIYLKTGKGDMFVPEVSENTDVAERQQVDIEAAGYAGKQVVLSGRSDRSTLGGYSGKQVTSTGRSDRSHMQSNDVAVVAREGDPPTAQGQARPPPKREAIPHALTGYLHSGTSEVAEPIVLVARGQTQGLAMEYFVIPWHQQEDASTPDKSVGDVAFSMAFMERRFGGRQGFEMIYHRGDSMAPTLIDGEEVVINTNVNSVEENAIYAINVNGRVMLRRVQINIDGSLLVMSDNPAYKPAEITAGNALNLKIIGRMVWPRVR